MDSKGNLYDNPTPEEIEQLGLIRLPHLANRFNQPQTGDQRHVHAGPPPLTRQERRKQERAMAKGRG